MRVVTSAKLLANNKNTNSNRFVAQKLHNLPRRLVGS